MNVTKDIITDLLPAYLAGECSADSRSLVKAYMKEHPDFAQSAKSLLKDTLVKSHLVPAADLKEMAALRKTKRILRLRSYLLALAIFFSLCPFSFLHTGDRTYFLFSESPQSALAYGAVGIIFWGIWAFMKRRARAF